MLEVALVSALLAVPACDGADCATPLRAGEPAPHDGQLLTTSLAIRLGQRADRCDAVVAIELERARALAAVDLALERELRRLETEAAARKAAALERAIEAAEPPWHERPAFVAAASAALSVAAMYAAARLAVPR